MDALAIGQIDVIVPARGRADEIGRMAEAVQVFKNAGFEQRALVEAELTAAEAERMRAAQAQAAVVKSLAHGLSALADGDLTCGIQQTFPSEYERLRSDFNTAVSRLEGLVSGIASNVVVIRSGSVEIAEASQDLSCRTEQQAASLEETAAAL